MELVQRVSGAVNQLLWGPWMLVLLVGVGVFFSVKLRFFQLTGFRYWWKKTALSAFGGKPAEGRKGISPFQAMATALAGSIGTGNMVGVANAIALGGAGAVFWMWVAAFFGMATVFAENVLGVTYRVKQGGRFVGGPMYYIEKGLHCRWLALLFALFCTLAAFGMGNMTQANAVAGALENSFSLPRPVTGAMLAAGAGVVIFGGIGRISRLTEKLVPGMALLYTVAVVLVLCFHAEAVPPAVGRILEEAFDVKAAAGGFLGYGMMRALKYGVSGGVFSNEAGLGSSPIVHAAAETDDPYEQGMWGFFQVFVDTIVLCTLMALCILTTQSDTAGMDSVTLSMAPFSGTLGVMGELVIALSMGLFGFATLVSWSYYGERSFAYLTKGRLIGCYRGVYLALAFAGCVGSFSLVWELSDTFNALMALPNLAALLLLSKEVSRKKCIVIRKKTEYNHIQKERQK